MAKQKTFKSPRFSMGGGFWAVENDRGNRLRIVENKYELGIHECGAIKVKEHNYRKICRRKA